MGNSEGQDRICQAGLKFSSEVEHFKRHCSSKIRALGLRGMSFIALKTLSALMLKATSAFLLGE